MDHPAFARYADVPIAEIPKVDKSAILDYLWLRRNELQKSADVINVEAFKYVTTLAAGGVVAVFTIVKQSSTELNRMFPIAWTYPLFFFFAGFGCLALWAAFSASAVTHAFNNLESLLLKMTDKDTPGFLLESLKKYLGRHKCPISMALWGTGAFIVVGWLLLFFLLFAQN